MKYSAVQKVEPVVSENDYVLCDVKRGRGRVFFSRLAKKVNLWDMAIIIVSLGVAVSLGFVIAGIVKAVAGAQTAINSISALL